MLMGGVAACDFVGSNSSSPLSAPIRAVSNTIEHLYSTPNAPKRRIYAANSAGHERASTDPAVNGIPMAPPLMGASSGNFWDHLRADFQVPVSDENQPQVQAQIRWFVNNQDYLDHTVKRAAPYMYFILQEAQKRNLPGELVLLPIIESAYNPFVSSYRGASGLWQLMPGTAYTLGVKQDWWFDGRRDIYSSTNAALDYLTYLQSFFGGNWLLALAAYDTGEGNVQNAVRRNSMDGLPTDFWALPLARETRSYVPRLLALAAIIRDPGKYGIVLPPISDKPYLQQVDLGVAINLSQAAQLAGMSLSELKQLNPGYSHMTTDPNGPYKLLLPIDRIALFKEQLAAMPSFTKTTWGRYRVQRGDSLASIANRYHASVAELRESNHIKGHTAPVGKVIMIPSTTESVVPHIDDTNMQQMTVLSNSNIAPAGQRNSGAAVVAADETQAISNVVQQTETVPAENLATNNDDNDQADESNDLVAGSAAITKQSQSVAHNVVQQKQFHTIKHGDTLASIARAYRVSISDLQHWNKLRNSHALKPGSKLVVGKSTTSRSSTVVTRAQQSTHQASHSNSNGGSGTYVVRPGDTIVKVAREEHIASKELFKFNHLSSSDLQPGQVLHIPSSGGGSVVASSSAGSAKSSHYTVRAGDTLGSIAKRTNVKVADLKKWNRLSANSSLKLGQRLVVRAG